MDIPSAPTLAFESPSSSVSHASALHALHAFFCDCSFFVSYTSFPLIPYHFALRSSRSHDASMIRCIGIQNIG